MKTTLPKTLKTIAFVSDAIYPHNKGGKEKRLYEISTRLAKMGHDVHVYTMKWWDGPKDRVEDGVHLHAISKLYPLYAGERRSIKQALFFGFASLRLITRDFDLIDADHMPHFPLFSLKLVSLIKRKPLYVVWNEVWGRKYWVEYMGISGNIAALVEWFSVRMPSHIVSVSDHTTQLLRETLKYNGKIDTIPNGINYDHIQTITPAPDTQIDVLYSGRMLKHKNLDILIRAIAELKDNGNFIKCTLIGNGPERKNLAALTRLLGLQQQIQFRDFVDSHDELYAFMKTAKVFALPSEREGFGIVAIEANACGTPVVTNNAPANAAKDLVTGGVNGYIYNRPTASSLATAIQTALNGYKLIQQPCINSAKEYDWDNLSHQTARVYS